MSTVYKYPVPMGEDEIEIVMPIGADILSIQVQQTDPRRKPHECVYLWARVDPAKSPVRRVLFCVGTGNPCPTGVRHIATVQTGAYVWHFFDGGET